jgi:hypothetical protein
MFFSPVFGDRCLSDKGQLDVVAGFSAYEASENGKNGIASIGRLGRGEGIDRQGDILRGLDILVGVLDSFRF